MAVPLVNVSYEYRIIKESYRGGGAAHVTDKFNLMSSWIRTYPGTAGRNCETERHIRQEGTCASAGMDHEEGSGGGAGGEKDRCRSGQG